MPRESMLNALSPDFPAERMGSRRTDATEREYVIERVFQAAGTAEQVRTYTGIKNATLPRIGDKYVPADAGPVVYGVPTLYCDQLTYRQIGDGGDLHEVTARYSSIGHKSPFSLRLRINVATQSIERFSTIDGLPLDPSLGKTGIQMDHPLIEATIEVLSVGTPAAQMVVPNVVQRIGYTNSLAYLGLGPREWIYTGFSLEGRGEERALAEIRLLGYPPIKKIGPNAGGTMYDATERAAYQYIPVFSEAGTLTQVLKQKVVADEVDFNTIWPIADMS